MKIVNISNFRKDLFNYVNQALEFEEPINICSKKGNVILMSEEEWRGWQETMYLCSIPGMKESIIEGMNTPTSECVEIDWRKELNS